MSLNHDYGDCQLGSGKWDDYFGKNHVPGTKRALFGIPFTPTPTPSQGRNDADYPDYYYYGVTNDILDNLEAHKDDHIGPEPKEIIKYDLMNHITENGPKSFIILPTQYGLYLYSSVCAHCKKETQIIIDNNLALYVLVPEDRHGEWIFRSVMGAVDAVPPLGTLVAVQEPGPMLKYVQAMVIRDGASINPLDNVRMGHAKPRYRTANYPINNRGLWHPEYRTHPRNIHYTPPSIPRNVRPDRRPLHSTRPGYPRYGRPPFDRNTFTDIMNRQRGPTAPPHFPPPGAGGTLFNKDVSP